MKPSNPGHHLILGATSGIAVAAARVWAARGDRFFLVARSADKLAPVIQDLKDRGGQVAGTLLVDLNDTTRHVDILKQAEASLGRIDVALLAHGVLGDSELSRHSFEEAKRILDTNFVNPVSLLTLLGDRMEKAQAGTIAVISSVAGERGRQSNYLYGSSKAGLTAFLSGLRNRLSPSGVRVLTIKPGFVDTAMIEHVRHKKSILWARPEVVGAGLVRAVDRGCDVVYLPGYWALIMFVVRAIPEFIFKRLKM